MDLSHNAQATVLLTCHFSKPEKDAAKPLSNSEWGRFALWLKTQGQTPADLLTSPAAEILTRWQDKTITTERLSSLLQRGHSLAIAMEKWARAGLWVVTRSDAKYPWRLKQKLKNDAPPVLFGCGNVDLLNVGGVAVVGSRNAVEDDLRFTMQVAERFADAGYGVVSGGARGIDEMAMQSALRGQGKVIGVLSDSLLKAATSSKWRDGLIQGKAVLLSPFYPEAAFSVGNAMARNKYVYCLAETALVVHSGLSGGTWNGALENLKHHWVPLWVKPTPADEAGNQELVNKGGSWCAEEAETVDITALFSGETSMIGTQPDIFSQPASQPRSLALTEPEVAYDTESPVDFYHLFLQEIATLTQLPQTLANIAASLQLTEMQTRVWLERALAEGMVLYLAEQQGYQWIE